MHAFLVHRMTGRWRTSWASADPLALVDMTDFDYSDELLGMVGLGREQMPELHAPGDVIGELKEDVAREVGLPAGLPVVSGVGDGQAAGLGANITEPGRAYLNLGTGIVSGTYSERYFLRQRVPGALGPDPEDLHARDPAQRGHLHGGWFVRRFAGLEAEKLGLDLSTEQILETAAARLVPGSGGLFAVPYWNNALMPYWDFDARGIMVGWTGDHGKAHAYRAILEGIAYEQRLMTTGAEEALERPVEHLIRARGRVAQPAMVPDLRRRHAAAGLRHAGGREHVPGLGHARGGRLGSAREHKGGGRRHEWHGRQLRARRTAGRPLRRVLRYLQGDLPEPARALPEASPKP